MWMNPTYCKKCACFYIKHNKTRFSSFDLHSSFVSYFKDRTKNIKRNSDAAKYETSTFCHRSVCVDLYTETAEEVDALGT